MAITHCSRGPLQTSAWCTSRRRAACSGTSDALGVDSGRCCRQRPVTPPPVSRYDDNLGFVQREVLPVIERERAAVVAAHGGQCPRCVQPWAAPRHSSSCEQARSGRATSTSLSRSPMERRHRALWRRRLDLGQSRPNSAGWASGSHRRAQRVAAAVPANRTRRRPKAVERGPESGSLVAGRTTCTSGGSRRGGTATSSSRRTSTSTQPRSLDAGGDAEGGARDPTRDGTRVRPYSAVLQSSSRYALQGTAFTPSQLACVRLSTSSRCGLRCRRSCWPRRTGPSHILSHPIASSHVAAGRGDGAAAHRRLVVEEMRSYRRQFEAVRDGAPQEQAGAAPVLVVMLLLRALDTTQCPVCSAASASAPPPVLACEVEGGADAVHSRRQRTRRRTSSPPFGCASRTRRCWRCCSAASRRRAHPTSSTAA